MEKERVIDLLNKGIERSKRWVEDAEKREDWNDVSFYQGQEKVLTEMKDIISNW